MDNINQFQTNSCKRHHSTDHTLSNNGNHDEISVSVSPCCFNLAEDGETESNLEVTNNNSFPIYFKLVTTNAVAMHFKPRSGRIEPHGMVFIKGYHAKSVTPIGLQQTIGVMTSRMPLEDWPEEDFCQPINFKETLEVLVKDRREGSVQSESSPSNEGFDYKKYRQQSFRSSDQHHSSSPRQDGHHEEIYKKSSRDEMENWNVSKDFTKDGSVQRSFYEFRPSSNAKKDSSKRKITAIKNISECSCGLCDGGEYDIDVYPKEYQKTNQTSNHVGEKHHQFQKGSELERNSSNYSTNAHLHPDACRKRNIATERNQDIESRNQLNLNTKDNLGFAGHEHDEDQFRFSRNQQKQQTCNETKGLSNLNKFQQNSPRKNDKKDTLPKETDEYSKNVNKSSRKEKRVARKVRSKCYCEHCMELNKSSLPDSEHAATISVESIQAEVGSTSSSALTKDISESSDIDCFHDSNNEERAVYRSLFQKFNKMLHKCNTVLQRVDSNMRLNFILMCDKKWPRFTRLLVIIQRQKPSHPVTRQKTWVAQDSIKTTRGLRHS
ncbi:hypothetical protein JTE90_028512 [Oedothorax gibbosus]|uniref:MSP domain-containing protein n=1 Tax=Oedothorax gibbosus TaxID=931172 RepID=A0AAV6VW49_9ARAC|nr:hypothetical protein JTE90_028512 [Oedothorax gibbosus]